MVDSDFTRTTGRGRPRLLFHCYRMLGLADQAEGLRQHALGRTRGALGLFEGRSSVRTWLHQIATPASEWHVRLPLPLALRLPTDDTDAPTEAAPAVPRLPSAPHRLLAEADEDLAVAASRAPIWPPLAPPLQHQPLWTRASLVVTHVMEWPAAEVAEQLHTTAVAVNCNLRWARVLPVELLDFLEDPAESAEPVRRALPEGFAAAIENADVDALAELLRSDVVLETHPLMIWFGDQQALVRYVGSYMSIEPGGSQLLPFVRGGHLTLALYEGEPDRAHQRHAVPDWTSAGTGTWWIVRFQKSRSHRLSVCRGRARRADPRPPRHGDR